MKKWFLLIVALIPALLFAAGLRIDLKLLADTLQKKPDHNAEALRKMGIDPAEIDYKSKPWWTFRSEDSLFKKLPQWDPVKKMSDDSWEASEALKAKLGPGPGEVLESQARAMAAQAQLNRQRMEQEMLAAEEGR